MNLFFKLSCCKPSLSTGIYFSKRYNKFAPFLQQIFSLFQMNEDERSSWMSCSVSLSLPTKQVTGLDRLIRLVLCDSAIFLWEATNSFNHIKKYFQPYQQICSLFLKAAEGEPISWSICNKYFVSDWKILISLFHSRYVPLQLLVSIK